MKTKTKKGGYRSPLFRGFSLKDEGIKLIQIKFNHYDLAQNFLSQYIFKDFEEAIIREQYHDSGAWVK